MKHISINNPGHVQIKKSTIPTPKEGEALLKLLYGGICGSDWGLYKGTITEGGYPRTLGHEFSAEIIEVGENNRGLKNGMIVTANPYFDCGTCYSCRRGLVNCCTASQTMSIQRDGAFAQYITMPVGQLYDGQGISPRILPLVEPFSTSYHGVKRANIEKGEKVLVFGAGTIGILAALAVEMFGGEAYITDVLPNRLEYANKLGVKNIILNDTPENLEARVKEITNGEGFDVTIEAAGLPASFQSCVDLAAYGSRVVVVGVGKKNLGLSFTSIQKKGLDILNSRNPIQRDFKEIIEILKKDEMNLEKIITHTYRFEDIQKVFEDMSQNDGAMLKVILEF